MLYICAGHNPTERGACNGDFCEHPEACLWVKCISEHLKAFNIEHKIVPTGTLKEKVSFINKDKKAKLAIELHFNSNVNARGSETLYCPESVKGKKIAETMQNEIAKVFSPNRGIKEGYYHQDEKAKKLLYFLEKTNCTALILEPEFISNKDKIVSKREECCRVIAIVLKEYIENIEE